MKSLLRPLALLALVATGALGVRPGESACCYFSAKDKDVLQPSQKAFLTWDPREKVESFTVQPKFEGNAPDFGMVIPTPSRPTLAEMPREFFKALAVFTILEPVDLTKYKSPALRRKLGGGPTAPAPGASRPRVRVLEEGIVGSLDYKVIVAHDAGDLFQWLEDHEYHYAGDRKTLDFYIQKGWLFTVMKIDPLQMKRRPDGSYEGSVTPTRFTFSSDRLIYPLKITQISVEDKTEALFYIQAPRKMDLNGLFSYQLSFCPMWKRATDWALPGKLTRQEKDWRKNIEQMESFLEVRRKGAVLGGGLATLEWAKKIEADDVAVLAGTKPYNRKAPRQEVEKLRLLQGHVKRGQFLTKMRKVFTKQEMTKDLVFVNAALGGRWDEIEYYSILPTSPP